MIVMTTTKTSEEKAKDMKKNSSSIVLRAKLAELHKTNEDLKQAKENAVDSWSDSRPVITVLEKLEKDLEAAKNWSAMSSIVSELESQLEATKLSIKSIREEELKVTTMIKEMNDDLEETREEMEEIKMECDEERSEREELKQVLKIRRQTLNTLQLTYRALRLEVECCDASAAEALQHITRSEKDGTTVELALEEFDAITRTADENTFLQEWRVSASRGQRFAAQESRDLAFKRYEELLCHDMISKENKIEDEITRADSFAEQANGNSGIGYAQSKFLEDEDHRSPQQLLDVSESSSGRKDFYMVKNLSLYAQVRDFVLQITKENLEMRRVKNLVQIGK